VLPLGLSSSNYLTPLYTLNQLEKKPFIKGRLKGRSPFKNNPSPSPLKERGIKGVRLISNLKDDRCSS